MPPWTPIHQSGLGAPQAFTRPLGFTESAFYWDAVFSGVSDALTRLTVETPTSHSVELFSLKNVTQTWITLKKLHPLLGASVREREGATGVDFVVDEARLNTVGPDEIMFESLQSDDAASALVDKLLNEPRTLSDDRLIQLWIISFPPDPLSTSVYHQVILLFAHCVCDGMGQNALITGFFDLLVHHNTPEKYIPKQSLKHRLEHHLAIEDLHPTRKYSLPRRRWRFAISKVMHSKRIAALRGGHSLPRTITPQTFHTPGVSRTLRLKLTKESSKRIMASCRRAQITFGQALPVLTQLALARVLHRLYLEGSMSEAEWMHRIRQPMHTCGPFNIRPYLDPQWLATGGADRVCLAISYYINTHPSMPISRSQGSDPNNKEPNFEALLSKASFFRRCREVKRQMDVFMNHPLLMEFTIANKPAIVEKARATALSWRARGEDGQAMVAVDSPMLTDTVVMSNRCSSLGNMDKMLPPKYPLIGHDDRHDVKRCLHITAIRHYLRCRPIELYLTSISYLEELQLIVLCDVRAYDEAMVKEWLSQVGAATEWYLGAQPGEESIMAKL